MDLNFTSHGASKTFKYFSGTGKYQGRTLIQVKLVWASLGTIHHHHTIVIMQNVMLRWCPKPSDLLCDWLMVSILLISPDQNGG